MKYKVLQRFITKSNVYTPGDVYQVDTPGKFTNRLIEYGFIEKDLNEDMFRRWEKYGVVSNLANVIIAPEDYTEKDKDKFTYEEALELEKSFPDGWRLPTRKEWVLICEEFALESATGLLKPDLIEKKLGLKENGHSDCDGLRQDTDSAGCYWSRTAYNAYYAYELYFFSSNLYPSGYTHKNLGNSVRCVKEL